MDPEVIGGDGAGPGVLRAALESVDEGVVVHDRDGTVVALNGAAAALFGRAREALQGSDPGALTAAEGPSGEALLGGLRRVADGQDGSDGTTVVGAGEELVVEDDACEWRAADDTWVRAEVTSVTGDNGKRLVATLRSVDRTHDRDRRPAVEGGLYRTLVEQGQDGIVVVQDGTFVFANEAMAELTGRPVADLEGRSYREVIAPEYHDLVAERYDKRVRGEEPPGRYRIEILTADGDRRHVDLSGSVIQYGGDPAALARYRDVTEHERRKRELEATTTRLELALEGTDTGVWEWDLNTDEVSMDETSERLCGFESGTFPGHYGGFEDRVPDDDISQVERAVQRVFETGEEHDVEFRVEHPDGETRWLQARGTVTDRGDVTTGPEATDSGQMIGVLTDITERKRRERELEKLTTRLELALEGTNTGVWEWDLNTDEVSLDETSERLFGFEPGTFPDNYGGFEDRVPDEDLPQVERAVQRAFETGEEYRAEFRVEHPDSETRWLQARGVVTDGGDVTTGPEATDSGRMIGVQTDVTERKRFERELETTAARLELALEGTDAGVWEWDLDTDEVVWDETSQRLFGYEPGSFPGTPEAVRRRIHSDDFLRVVDQVDRAIETGNQYRADFRVEHPGGETRWLQTRGVVEYENGEPDRVLGIHSDITERKRREQELEELTTRLELAMEETGTGVWEWDLDTDEVVWDDSTERLFGYEPGSFPGTYDAFVEHIHPEDTDDVERAIERVIETGEEYRKDFRVQRPGGETRWLQARGVVKHDGEDPDRMVGVVTDVTERKRRERDLERLTTRLELALEGTDTGVWEWNLDTDEVIWDETSEQLFGYDVGEFPGTYGEFRDRVHSEDLPSVERAVEEAIERDEPFHVEFRVEHPDDETRWLQARGDRVDGALIGRSGQEDDRWMIGVQTDVTERKRHERELEELTTRLELAMEETGTGVWEWDLDTDEVVWDEASERLFGYEPGTFPGTQEAFLERIHPEDVTDVERAIQRAIEADEGYQAEYRVELPDDETRWIQSRGVVEYEDGEPDRMLGVQTDTTERKRSERELEAQNERLELMNRIVRHDIRNDMEVILSNVGLLEERLEDVENVDVNQCLTQVRWSGDHVVELTEVVRDIMQTAHAEADVGPVNLQRVLVEELAAVRSMDRVTVREPDPPSVKVLADDSLGTVFHNLLTNAVRHNDRETPTVEMSVTEHDERVVVRVADDGPGVPEDRREEVFARGEKSLGSPGSGLGLYLVDRLLEEYGGDVWIEDNEPRGAVFAVALCRADAPTDVETGGDV